jgi:hypothetical protein
MFTDKQIAAILAIAATGTAGLQHEVDGKRTVHGNTEWALLGRSFKSGIRVALIESKSHGLLRKAKSRVGSRGTYEVHDMRYHLTAAGQKVAALLSASDAVKAWAAAERQI